MDYSISEMIDFVNENDIKFIRLAFCDIYGTMKNIAINADELKSAFEKGKMFEASEIKGFEDAKNIDLYLHPDASTIAVLPWRPQHGRVARFYCDITYRDGQPYQGDSRYIFRRAIKRAEDMGLTCRIGTECEFYLFETDEKGKRTSIPHDEAGYMDVAPLDKGENVRREICLALEEMGIKPESSHHEHGPGQNEIDFKSSDALAAADNFLTFKSVVSTIAARNGLSASFLPKPIVDKSGNGLHINMAIYKNSINIFNGYFDQPQKIASSFIAGIMSKIREITAFTNPLKSSYDRLGSFEAPKYITWSHQNYGQLIRIPKTSSNETSRIEFRSPDPCCNPYIVFAMLLESGISGIINNNELQPACDVDLCIDQTKAMGIEAIPDNIEQAINLAKNSKFVQSILMQNIINNYFKWDKVVL